MSSCGAVVGGVSLDSVDITKQAIIQGVATVDGVPAAVGYARLLDRGGDFVAEVPLSARGEFRFFAAPGRWTVVLLTPGRSERYSVTAEVGAITDLEVEVA